MPTIAEQNQDRIPRAFSEANVAQVLQAHNQVADEAAAAGFKTALETVAIATPCLKDNDINRALVIQGVATAYNAHYATIKQGTARLKNSNLPEAQAALPVIQEMLASMDILQKVETLRSLAPAERSRSRS